MSGITQEESWIQQLDQRQDIIIKMRGELSKDQQCLSLRKWRKAYGWKLPQLARRAGIEVEKLIKFENGIFTALNDEDLFTIQFFQTFKRRHLQSMIEALSKFPADDFFDRLLAFRAQTLKTIGEQHGAKAKDADTTEENADKAALREAEWEGVGCYSEESMPGD